MTNTPRRSTRIRLLLLLTVVGFVTPNTYVNRYFRANGVSAKSAREFFAAWTATMPTASLTADLGITSLTFGLWSFWDSRDSGTKHWWLVPVGTATVGICFSAPLYLLMRELATSVDAH
ncbi:MULTISPECIES: DUF2834 domain-containing protein [Nocardiaceae]|uniref:DUF2834 domain-containing protein n=1 Tax=Nocardiaceae TaxID=85025 RepID=UPI00068A4E6A|nr:MULTISPECIES: DUF2834 domain-containing protein [Rhodococcus]